MRQTARLSALLCSGFALLLLAGSPATALPIEASVGSGPDTAYIQVEFSPTGNFLFEVAFDESAGVSGIDALTIIRDALPAFDLVILDFFGPYVDGISYGAFSNEGFIAPEGFWHYWNKDDVADPWSFADVGAVDRLLSDGAVDGWRYGHPGAPTPEPGTGVLACLGLAALAGRRRRRRGSLG